MIDPYFFQNFSFPIEEFPPGVSYRVFAYAIHDRYTLISWEYGDDEEFFTGETLFRDRDLIATSGGALELLEAPEPEEYERATPPTESVWNRVNANSGKYGVSDIVALALRDTANQVILIDR